ncbi:MAG: hypothetical protein H0U43_05710 [Chthoniobacterales bacterium]|nr:hypothetical protein [Chthoniobacterales bacterium]
MPRFRETVPIDDYVLDVLMRDIVGHDRQPAAYLVYLYLYGQAARDRWNPVPSSLRMLASPPACQRVPCKPARTLAAAGANRNDEPPLDRNAGTQSSATLASMKLVRGIYLETREPEKNQEKEKSSYLVPGFKINSSFFLSSCFNIFSVVSRQK